MEKLYNHFPILSWNEKKSEKNEWNFKKTFLLNLALNNNKLRRDQKASKNKCNKSCEDK